MFQTGIGRVQHLRCLFTRQHFSKSKILISQSLMEISKQQYSKELPVMADTCPAIELQKKWYPRWEANKYFFRGKRKPLAAPSPEVPPFVVMLPPPNVTGTLHLGHALTVTLQDAHIRWQGMMGRDVLWVPGCDHAGIATQVVLEKHLRSTTGLTRHQLGRERFVQEAWSWKEAKEARIYEQLRLLGAALDWDRAVFTLDEGLSAAVVRAFITLFERDLVYRQSRFVNYCPALQSVISDIEVDHLSVEGPTEVSVPGHPDPVTVGVMYEVAYPVVDGGPGDRLVISTTRPETIPADTAVMVHPHDQRYCHLVGRRVWHPCRPNHSLPVIADTAVDTSIGTGAVKVTPAHSAVDHAVGQRHGLPSLRCFGSDGTFGDLLPHLKGMPRLAARSVIVSLLRASGLLKAEKRHAMTIPICSRTGDLLETIVQPQWFVRMQAMAEKACEVVESGELVIEPPSQRAVWLNWMAKAPLQDWCISRQLWWGHRVPVYRVMGQTEDEQDDLWIAAASQHEAKEKAALKLGVAASSLTVQQDEDVLDTWFSSALFPFAALGWPENTPDLSLYYPNSVLVTGHDILFFWVARMVMLATELTGQLPFKRVLLHGLVTDASGAKMSKSRGNVIDPIHLIAGNTQQEPSPTTSVAAEHNSTSGPAAAAASSSSSAANSVISAERKAPLPVVGADVLRFTLLSLINSGDQVPFGEDDVMRTRPLTNKMWQTVRFLRQACLRTEHPAMLPLQRLPLPLSALDRWLLHRTQHFVQTAQDAFNTNNLAILTSSFTAFWKTVMCDVYLEAIKPVIQAPSPTTSSDSVPPALRALSVLSHCTTTALLCIAPVMPHLAEELYHCMPPVTGHTRLDSIFEESYPLHKQWSAYEDKALDEEVLAWQDAITGFRNIKASYHITDKALRGSVYSSCGVLTGSQHSTELQEMARYLAGLGTLDLITVTQSQGISSTRPDEPTLFTTLGDNTVLHLHVQDGMDVAREVERLEKKTLKLQKQLKFLTKKAPRNHNNTKVRLEQTQQDLQKIERMMESLRALL